MLEVENFLNDVTYQTYEIFGSEADEKKLSTFREYLEDITLFDIISCNKSILDVQCLNGNVSDNVKTALIASGISRNGTIPIRKQYVTVGVPVTRDLHYYAKERVIEIDNERLNGNFKEKMENNLLKFKQNPYDFPNISELISLGISQNERNCGYVEDLSGLTDFFEGVAFATWLTKKQVLEDAGLENTMTYDICSQIYARPHQKHYPLATAQALKQIAEIEMFALSYGIDEVNDELIQEALRNIEAAKITDKQLIDRYEFAFKSLVRRKKSSSKLLRLPSKKSLGLMGPKK
jgi:hypothetical protein